MKTAHNEAVIVVHSENRQTRQQTESHRVTLFISAPSLFQSECFGLSRLSISPSIHPAIDFHSVTSGQTHIDRLQGQLDKSSFN